MSGAIDADWEDPAPPRSPGSADDSPRPVFIPPDTGTPEVSVEESDADFDEEGDEVLRVGDDEVMDAEVSTGRREAPGEAEFAEARSKMESVMPPPLEQRQVDWFSRLFDTVRPLAHPDASHHEAAKKAATALIGNEQIPAVEVERDAVLLALRVQDPGRWRDDAASTSTEHLWQALFEALKRRGDKLAEKAVRLERRYAREIAQRTRT